MSGLAKNRPFVQEQKNINVFLKPPAINLISTVTAEEIQAIEKLASQVVIERLNVFEQELFFFHISCRSGTVEAVKSFLARHPGKINIANNKGFAALHFAASGGHVDIVRLLLDKIGVAQINMPDEDGDTVLHLAAASGHIEIAAPLAARLS